MYHRAAHYAQEPVTSGRIVFKFVVTQDEVERLNSERSNGGHELVTAPVPG